MNYRIFLAILTGLIVFSSCSNKRYGYISKVKVKTTPQKETIRTHKQKVITMLKSKTITSPKINYYNSITVPVVELQKSQPPVLVTTPKNTKEQHSITAPAQTKARNVAVKETKTKARQSNFWDDLEEDLYDLLMTLAFIIVGTLLLSGLTWLTMNGLTWLAVLIVAAIIVGLVVLICGFVSDLADSFSGFFKRRY